MLRQRNNIGYVVLVLALLLGSLQGCSSDKQSSPSATASNQGNTSSINIAGPLSSKGLQQVSLTASLESTAPSDGVTYQWSQTSGETVSLQGEQSATLQFISPASEQTLTFEVQVSQGDEENSKQSVNVNVDNQLNLAPAITQQTYTASDPTSYDKDSDCGSFEPNWHESSWDWTNLPAGTLLHEFNAGPLAVVMGNDYSNLASADDTALTDLQSNTTAQTNLINNLLWLRSEFTNTLKVDVSNIVSNSNGLCYRTVMYVTGTLVWNSDTTPSSGAGTGAHPDLIPWMSVPHTEIIELTAANFGATRTIPHELMHAQQADISRGYYEGWKWYIESYAEFSANYLSGDAEYLAGYHFMRHWAIDADMLRYNSWPWWGFLASKFGREFTGDVLQRRAEADETLMQFVKRILPFDCSDEACKADVMANVYGEFAASTANYADHYQPFAVNLSGSVRDAAIDDSLGESRVSGKLEQIDEGHYRISDWLAPQRFAHNIIEIIPDSNSDWLAIDLTGFDIPLRQSEWRATLVATLDETANPPVQAMMPMFSSGQQVVDLSQWQTELGQSIERLELVVAATPKNWKHAQELPPFSGDERPPALDRYVYELNIKGGWPLGHEPESLRDAHGEAGSAHANGGGFVANTANVAATAYVGPQARVLGNAQVLDSARLEGRAHIQDNVIVRNSAIVSSNAKLIDNVIVEHQATVRDNVKLAGSVRVSDESKIQGGGYFGGSFNTSQNALVLGSHINIMTNGSTLNGTSLSNGHTWLDSSATYSMGVGQNDWTVDGQGLISHYDFEGNGSYRMEDNHADQAAYYLNNENTVSDNSFLISDASLSSQVIEFDGQHHLWMPKYVLDQANYQLSLKLNVTGQSEQVLFSATTEKSETLQISILPSSNNVFDLMLSFTNRDGVVQESILSNGIHVIGQWLKLELSFSDIGNILSLQTKNLDDSNAQSTQLTLAYETRQLHYDSLQVLFSGKEKGFMGKLDDVRLSR